MDVIRKLLMLIAIACFVCIGGYYLYKYLMMDHIVASSGRAHYEAWTINRLRQIAFGIQQIAQHKNEKPPKDMKSLSEYVRRHMEYLESDRCFDPNDGLIIDLWNTPVTLMITKTEYTFISSGYNKIFENGKGDDIAVIFDPFDPKKESRTKHNI